MLITFSTRFCTSKQPAVWDASLRLRRRIITRPISTPGCVTHAHVSNPTSDPSSGVYDARGHGTATGVCDRVRRHRTRFVVVFVFFFFVVALCLRRRFDPIGSIRTGRRWVLRRCRRATRRRMTNDEVYSAVATGRRWRRGEVNLDGRCGRNDGGSRWWR